MDRTRLIGLLLGVSLWTSSARAQEPKPPVTEITYEQALALARREAPTLQAARARVGEARSEVHAASVRPFNPQLFTSAGPRFEPGTTMPQASVGVLQWLELGGQRGDRIEAARAGVDAGTARSDNAQRLLVRDVSLAFASALYWERRVALARQNLDIAQDIARIAARRHDVGDAGGLEESAAAVSLLRARSDVDRTNAALTRAEGRLAALLGLEVPGELACRGDLRRIGELDAVAPDLDDRPDLRALRAEIRQAKAEAERGRGERVPDVAVGAVYSREESADIVQGTLRIALPVLDRGQGVTAVARARARRVRSELDAAVVTANLEADTAQSVAGQLGAAAREFEDDGLRTLQRAERLATASYEAGAIPLGELLIVRRELVQAQLDYAELLLGAATARIELAASTGALQ